MSKSVLKKVKKKTAKGKKPKLRKSKNPAVREKIVVDRHNLREVVESADRAAPHLNDNEAAALDYWSKQVATISEVAGTKHFQKVAPGNLKSGGLRAYRYVANAARKLRRFGLITKTSDERPTPYGATKLGKEMLGKLEVKPSSVAYDPAATEGSRKKKRRVPVQGWDKQTGIKKNERPKKKPKKKLKGGKKGKKKVTKKTKKAIKKTAKKAKTKITKKGAKTNAVAEEVLDQLPTADVVLDFLERHKDTKGVNRKGLAKKAGVPYGRFSKWLRGRPKGEITADEFAALVEVMEKIDKAS